MENLINFSLFGSGIIFGIAILLLFISLIASDIEENGWGASVSLGIFLGLNYFWGNFPVLEYLNLRNIGIYLFIGFLFSLIRTYFKGKELNKTQKEYFNLKEHVFRWWFLFPICMINWVFGKLLKDLYNLLYSKVSKIYTIIFNA